MLSIIIPVYNTEQYLSACIDSVLAQTYADYELLLVDDGSTDRSGEVCDDYALKDERIRVFHKENGGVSSARNLGIDNANGDWICFLDADDTLVPDSLSTYTESLPDNIDLVTTKYQIKDESGRVIIDYSKFDDREFELNDFLFELFTLKKHEYQGYIWGKLLRGSVIRDKNIRFRENIYFNEDRLFIVEFVCASKKNILYRNHLSYNYILHQTNATSSLSKVYNKRFVTDFDAMLLMRKCIRKHTSFSHFTVIDESIEHSYHRNEKMMFLFDQYSFRNHIHMATGILRSGTFRCGFIKQLLKPFCMLVLPSSVYKNWYK